MICGRVAHRWTGPGGSSPAPRSGTEAVEGAERKGRVAWNACVKGPAVKGPLKGKDQGEESRPLS